MGIDLELADVAAAIYRSRECRAAGGSCRHDPGCDENYERLLAGAAADRPGEAFPSEFRYRHFHDINANMLLTAMGYAATPEPWFAPVAGPDDELSSQRLHEADLRWRSQTPVGRTGIPAFKLQSNDRWLVTDREIDEALAAYSLAAAELRAELETDEKWVRWLEWLAVARKHGGFEAE